MKFLKISPQNRNYKWGFYQFRMNGKIKAIGFCFPFLKLDIRFWFGKE